MQSLLTTMGILLANYDERRDFLANFEPFVEDRLRNWPEGQPVGSKKLSEALTKAFSFPPIPLHTVTDLISRAKKAGYLKRGRDGKEYPYLKNLREVEGDVLGQRSETLAHFATVNDALRAYAAEKFALDWSEEETDRALEAFSTEFGIEMAEARQAGRLDRGRNLDRWEMLSVVHGFARDCLHRDAVNFGYLEEMVRGSMLTSVLYFKDLGSWTPTLENLIVFLDTPIALRLLGLAPEELRLGAEELMEMLVERKVPVRVFEHTVSEMLGVLEGVRSNLERARQQQLDLASLTNLNREVIEHLMHEGWGPSAVQEVMGDIDARLAQVGIAIEPTPPYTRALSVDDGRFEQILLSKSFTKAQVSMDIKSITAVHRLRKGEAVRSLTRAGAIFITPNPGLARASNFFFREQGLQSTVGQCMVDVSLTTRLWLAKPSESEGAPRKMLIAECYAALNPPHAVWKKYLEKIAARRKAGEVTDEQVKTLVFSSAAQEGLFEVIRNDPDLINDQTPLEVIKRYEETIRGPIEIETRRVEEELQTKQTENEELRSQEDRSSQERQRQEAEFETQRRRLHELEEWQRDSDHRRARRLKTRRLVLGLVGAIVALGGGVVVVATDTISGSLGFAVVVFIAVFISLGFVGWGLRKPLKWSNLAIIWIGAFLAFFAVLYGLAQSFMD
jgi:hypothetical protein